MPALKGFSLPVVSKIKDIKRISKIIYLIIEIF